MLSLWVGLIAAAMMGTLAAVATTATAAQDTFLVIGLQDGGGERFATLRCDPASGTHPHPVSACRVLREAGGDFTKIVGKPGTLCPALHEPVTASASGDYLGGQVLFRRTYPNRCDLARHTGPVFEL